MMTICPPPFFTNGFFLGTFIYIFMESMLLPLACNIFNSAEIGGFP